MTESTRDLIAQRGGKSAKFEAIGDTIAGKITATAVLQVRNFQTNEPETWDNGDPKQQIAITVESDTRDASDPEDDGQRTVYVKWWGLQRRALQDAVAKAGDDDIRVGGHFSATYVGDGEQRARGFNPPKLYAYIYEPPSATAGMMQQPTQQVAPVAVAQPASTPAPAGTPAADPQAALAQIKALIAAGLTDEQIAAAVPTFTPDAIAAVRAIPA